MNGYERIAAAIKGKATDTTPIMLHNFMMAAQEFGVTMEQYRNDPKVIANTFIDSIERYKYDGVLIDIDTVTLAGAIGVPIDFPTNEPARSNRGNLLNMSDVKNLKSINIENYKYIQIWLEAVSILKNYFKNEIYVRGNCDQAPFSLASMMRTPQNWMVDLMITEEEQIFELLEYTTDISSQFIKLMHQTGADMVSNGDSPAGPEMISPEMYKKFAQPYEKKVVDVAHKLGVPYGLHICGNTESILEPMLATGADMIELDYKTDISKIHSAYHDKVAFFGNIDPSGVLALGSPELVRKKTLKLLKEYSNSNYFVLNAGCALPATTPTENIKAMIETARNFDK